MKSFLSPARAAGVVFLLSLAVWAFQFHGKLPAVTDEVLFSYPSQSVNLFEWRKGFIPLWDAYTGCGMPQLGNDLSACFYPPFWVFFLTGLSHWLVWMSLFHTAFAFFGFFLWARSQKITQTWAVLTAISFAGSLHMTRIWAYPMFSAAQSWTPWVFFTAGRFLEQGQRRWWLALTGTIGVQLLAGYPFFSFYTLFFLAVWMFLHPAGLRRRWAVAGAAGMALLLAAIQVLPFADTLSYSTRGGWGGPGHFPYFSRGAEFLTLFSPTALGFPGTVSYQGQDANASFMMYFGLIPLAAWALGFFFSKSLHPKFWRWSALGWILWMMGGAFPLWKIIPENLLELLNPSKAVGVFLLAALTGAGLAMNRFFQFRISDKTREALVWGITCLWLLDVLSVPVRTVFPVADPFLKPDIQSWAQKVKEAAQNQRIVSLHPKNQRLVYGSGDNSRTFGAAADLWAGDLLANSNAVWGIRTSHAYVSTWTQGMDQLWKNFNQIFNYKGRLADLAGVRALSLPITLDYPHYRILEKDGDDYLILNEHCENDAWIAPSAKIFDSREVLLSQLTGEESQPGPIEKVYLEKSTSLPAPGRNLPANGGAKTVRWERMAGSRASFSGDFTRTVKTPPGNTSWLVWNETYTPGWRAWVDGLPAPLLRAFGFFFAVPAPSAGIHEVELRYEPTSFRLGLFVSLASLWLVFLI